MQTEPEQIPDAVLKSFEQWKSHYQCRRSTDAIPKLMFDNLLGCYYFTYHEIFYGIELDGYLHT